MPLEHSAVLKLPPLNRGPPGEAGMLWLPHRLESTLHTPMRTTARGGGCVAQYGLPLLLTTSLLERNWLPIDYPIFTILAGQGGRQCEDCQPLFGDEDVAAERRRPLSPLLKGRADAKYQDHPHHSRQGSYLATLGSEGTVQSLHQQFLAA